VVDYRLGQLDRLPNVEVYRESRMTADEVLGYGFQHVAVATGARWRDDGAGRWHTKGIPLSPTLPVFTPDDVMRGRLPQGGRVVLFDDDHYYIGGVIAEGLVQQGITVTLVTPSPTVSSWTAHTLELDRVQTRMRELDIDLRLSQTLVRTEGSAAVIACMHTGRETVVEADAVVLVTARLPHEELALDLRSREAEWADAGLVSVTAVGDALAPSTIAAAVWDGRRFAEDLGAPPLGDATPFRREVVFIEHPRARTQSRGEVNRIEVGRVG
jgi:dimethylamine/trimethylamine dehydrogenase